jgi:hypothetical protein
VAVYIVFLIHPGAPFPSIALPPPPVVSAKPVNLEFVQTLPDERRIVLLTIVTHSDFGRCVIFREQVHFILEGLKAYPIIIQKKPDRKGETSA